MISEKVFEEGGGMTVTVVIPSFNSARFIGATLDSVLAQTLKPSQIVVVDDASTDDTLRVLREYETTHGIEVVVQAKNSGAARARNEAIKRATGRFIAFIDADDVWHPDKLAMQLGAMAKYGWAFTYTPYVLIDESGVVVGQSLPSPRRASHSKLLRGCFIQNSTVVYDVEAIGAKVFCPDLRKRQDFGLFLALLKRTSFAYEVGRDGVWCGYRMVAGSVSAAKSKNISHQWDIYRNVEALSLASATFHMASWFVFAATKWWGRRLRSRNVAERRGWPLVGAS